jgi:hypothetical protein
MMRQPKPLVVFVSALALALSVGACGGASPGPANPDNPPLDDPPKKNEVAAASSAKVQSGIDAIQGGD